MLSNKHQSGLPVDVETVNETVEAVAEEFAGVVDVLTIGEPEVVNVVRGLFVGLIFGSS